MKSQSTTNIWRIYNNATTDVDDAIVSSDLSFYDSMYEVRREKHFQRDHMTTGHFLFDLLHKAVYS